MSGAKIKKTHKHANSKNNARRLKVAQFVTKYGLPVIKRKIRS
jgi:hypothetical protein